MVFRGLLSEPFVKGLLFLVAYDVLTASKGVFLGSFLQVVDPFLVLSICFSLVTLLFLALNKSLDGRAGFWPPLSYRSSRIAVGLNFSSVLSWASIYLALKLIEPAIAISVTTASGPILTAIYQGQISKERAISTKEWIHYFMMTLIMIFLVWEGAQGLSALPHITGEHVVLGVTLSLVCGAANVANALMSKKLNDRGLSARQIIPFRFYLLIGLGFLLCPSEAWPTLKDSQILFSIFMIALFGLSLPIFCVQRGIEYTGPLVSALVQAALPAVVVVAQLFDGRLVVSEASAVGAALIVAFGVGAAFERSRKAISPLHS